MLDLIIADVANIKKILYLLEFVLILSASSNIRILSQACPICKSNEQM